MLQFIYFGIAVLLAWLQLAGVTAAVGPRFGSWAIGRCSGVLLVVMIGFLLEHVIGLGSLAGVWLASSVLAIWFLWKNWPRLMASGFGKSELVFAIAFAYGLMWKFGFPAIAPSAERLTDLYFIGNYLPGKTLPPVDHWFPPYRFDFYYSLQHYGAALLGRLLHLSPGLTYNISFAILMALPLTLAWEVAGRFIANRAGKLLLVAALACGGTGASALVYFTTEAPAATDPHMTSNDANNRMWLSARFIGNFSQYNNSPFVQEWFQKKTPGDPNFRNLPLENFGYQYYVGDYHPPLGGFLLLLLAVALIMALEKPDENNAKGVSLARQAMLALTIPATIATNTWVFPLQAALVGAWVLRRHWAARGQPALAPSWQALLAGGLGGSVLLYPFLAGFAARTLSTPVASVAVHTPLVPFLILAWPLLVLFGLALFFNEKRGPTLFFALAFLGLLLMSECIFIDDPSIAEYQRTNSVMKWWGWIWTGALVALGAPLLGSSRAWVRATAGLALAGTLIYALDTVNYWRHSNEIRYAGKLNGDELYVENPAVRRMFRYLAVAPDGIVLENLYSDAYNDGGAFAAFAVKPTLLGWPAHLITWHGKVQEVVQRRDQIRAFYAGQMDEPAAWLLANDVRYVVWRPQDAETPLLWQRMNNVLDSKYAWRVFGFSAGLPVGIWVRR